MGRQPTGSAVTELLSEFHLPADANDGKPASAIHESPSRVQALLDEHPFLIDLLPEIRGKLRGFFANSSVSLTVTRDPDETDRLVVAVTTDLSPGDAISRLGEFDRTWWLENLDRAQGKVCIDVEFG
jgi:hypothetical protein